MPRTPLLRSVVRLARDNQRALALGLPVAALRERIQETHEKAVREGRPRVITPTPSQTAAVASRRGFSRRAFLGGGAAAVAAATMLPRSARAAPHPSIAIIGAGIAGLSAALRMSDQGVAATIYESSNRLGGRMFSNSTYFDQNQVFEWAGELIDSNHATIHELAARFGLAMDDLRGSEPAGSNDTFYFNGRYYPKAQADADFTRDIVPVLDTDIRLAKYPTNVFQSTEWGRMLDNMSVYDWIESRVPGGHSSPMGALLDTAYYIEYNSDTRDQSSLNLLYLLAYQPHRGVLEMFGYSDETWHIRGGNQQIPVAIANHLGPDAVKFGHRLTRIRKTPAGATKLTFLKANGSSEEITYDVVLLCTPFATLRTLDYSQADFDAQKNNAIQNLGAGRQSKQHLQFHTRVWNQKFGKPDPGNGSSYADTGYQSSWETTRAQPGTMGILVGYAGGPFADAMSSKVAFATATSAHVRLDAQRFLQQAEPVFQGLTGQWNGKATQGLPHLDPNFNCSYSYFKVGQYQTIGAYERVRQGNVWFAGEHCSMDFQGFMEGGAIEGWGAALNIMKDQKIWGQ